MCEGGPVLLAVLHLLHHDQSSSLHIHGQCVLLTLSYLCQLREINIQLDLKQSSDGKLNTQTNQGFVMLFYHQGSPKWQYTSRQWESIQDKLVATKLTDCSHKSAKCIHIYIFLTIDMLISQFIFCVWSRRSCCKEWQILRMSSERYSDFWVISHKPPTVGSVCASVGKPGDIFLNQSLHFCSCARGSYRKEVTAEDAHLATST